MSNPNTPEAKRLVAALKKKGIKLGHVEALDVIAILKGCRSHQAAPASKQKPKAETGLIAAIRALLNSPDLDLGGTISSETAKLRENVVELLDAEESEGEVDLRKVAASMTKTQPQDWEDADGPESGCGVDYFLHNAKTGQWFYANCDQGHWTYEVKGDDESPQAHGTMETSPVQSAEFIPSALIRKRAPLVWDAFSSTDNAPFSWGNNNRTLVDIHSFLNHAEECCLADETEEKTEQLEALRKFLNEFGKSVYIDLEN